MDNQTELAWAAGFFDGEGSTGLAKGTNSDVRRKPRLSVPQKGRECLDRFQRALNGLGKVYERTCGVSFFSIQNARGVDTALNLLWPYLSNPKRQQALAAGFVPGQIRCPKIGRPKKEAR